jgi:hypothetical protein
MHQSSTLYLGLDVHKESLTVADVAQDSGGLCRKFSFTPL